MYRRNLIIDQVAQHRIPAVYTIRLYPESGGLVSYGVDFADQFRQAANYADRILKGAKVAELPVQQPTKFELVLNLKTAKALGLKVPLHLQQHADELIESVSNIRFALSRQTGWDSRKGQVFWMIK